MIQAKLATSGRFLASASAAAALLALALAVLLAPAPVRAQGGPPEAAPGGPPVEPKAEASPGKDESPLDMAVQRMKVLLKLTPEQVARLRPILEENEAKVVELRQKYFGASQGQPGAMGEAFKKAMVALHEGTNQKIAAILMPAQLEVWNKVQAQGQQRGRRSLPPGPLGRTPRPAAK
jgi:hypothetical protein